ncbi:glycosyltransferase [Halorubrum sp. CBA1125]|uniref:glycosyltransferase family 4 protein n=1 Tax=Halorubrum sp. CBA1125 TaxID=2668072 RepID=UPI0012E8E481|nr:glycosyltransferase family 4 protein [Halorubrum sp. CBA1125]MUW13420.1 glycosyltransferase [Halorubrum sp. CBA1125]
MRILFVTEEPIRFSGTMVRGGQIHVKNVIAGLRERGHNVHLVDWNSEPDRQFQHSLTPRCRFIEGPFRTLRRVLNVGKTLDPDVIVSKTRKVYLPGLVAARVLGVPHIVHVGSSLDPPTGGFIDRIDSGSFVARLRAPHDAYFVVCDALGDELRARGINSERIYDVRNAVDATRFVPEPDVSLSNSIRRQLEDVEGPLLGFVGGLTDYKGVFDLANAVEQTDMDPIVVVAGNGPARDRFERELGERGIFLGSVDYELMPAVYAAIDALVLPSHTEGLPRVLLEAGAAGRPVVATTVGGVPEVVSDGETGLLCPPRDPSRLASVITELFTERQPVEMGRRARKLIVDEYTWDAQYDRYESFLTDVVSR